MNLNIVAKNALENAKRREANEAKIDSHTLPMLKHCAGEVIEATEAYVDYAAALEHNKETEENTSGAEEAFASELADVICCILIISANENIDIEEAVCKCMLKNAKRAYGDGDKL